MCAELLVSWHLGPEPLTRDIFMFLKYKSSELMRVLNHRIKGRYIRVLGIGDTYLPHMHLLVPPEVLVGIESILKKVSYWSHQPRILEDVEGHLSYLWDHNYLEMMRRNDRPKGFRPLFTARGLQISYPSNDRITQEWGLRGWKGVREKR